MLKVVSVFERVSTRVALSAMQVQTLYTVSTLALTDSDGFGCVGFYMLEAPDFNTYYRGLKN